MSVWVSARFCGFPGALSTNNFPEISNHETRVDESADFDLSTGITGVKLDPRRPLSTALTTGCAHFDRRCPQEPPALSTAPVDNELELAPVPLITFRGAGQPQRQSSAGPRYSPFPERSVTSMPTEVRHESACPECGGPAASIEERDQGDIHHIYGACKLGHIWDLRWFAVRGA